MNIRMLSENNEIRDIEPGVHVYNEVSKDGVNLSIMIANFGEGKVAVCNEESHKGCAVVNLCNLIEAKPVGYLAKGKHASDNVDNSTMIKLIFTNLKSIEVLEDSIREAKEQLRAQFYAKKISRG